MNTKQATDAAAITLSTEPGGDKAIVTGGKDFTGRDRLVANVLFTWAGQLVFIAAGFVMPRMIDYKLGQEVLGVWDFSWSLVTYFSLVQLGITSSVNRHVAKFYGKQDIAGVNRVVSSATCVLTVAGSIVFLLTIVAVVSLPHWFGMRLKEHVPIAQGSVFFLGAALTVQTALGAFNGALTGCHRWELQSMRLSFWHFLTVTAMLVALMNGAGLLLLAGITFAGQALGQVTMVTIAFRACEGLRVRRSLIEWQLIKDLYLFSGKTLVPSISAMLLNQTTSLLILGSLGPAALALFTRPRSLMHQLDALERKMAMILTPTASSLESVGDTEEIERLLIKSVRYSLYLVLPVVLVLTVFGGPVMRLWMGQSYANGEIPAILGLGLLGACIQTPILSILEGMNAHGRGGLGQFVGSLVSATLAFCALRYFHAGLVGVALAVTLPVMMVNLMYLPSLLCRRFGYKLGVFYRMVTFRPLLHLLPFALCLLIGRWLFESNLVLAMLTCLGGGMTLAISYWKSVLPEKLKIAVRLSVKNVIGFLRLWRTSRTIA